MIGERKDVQPTPPLPTASKVDPCPVIASTVGYSAPSPDRNHTL